MRDFSVRDRACRDKKVRSVSICRQVHTVSVFFFQGPYVNLFHLSHSESITLMMSRREMQEILGDRSKIKPPFILETDSAVEVVAVQKEFVGANAGTVRISGDTYKSVSVNDELVCRSDDESHDDRPPSSAVSSTGAVTVAE